MSLTSPPYLETADRIGRQLSRDALWAGSRCNWMGWTLIYNLHRWQHAYRAQPAALYDGVAGIVLFLSSLVKFTSDKLERATLLGAIAQLRKGVDELSPQQYLGFHSGLAGIAHALFQCAETLEDTRLIDAGLDLLIRLADAPFNGSQLDVIGGSAGSIPLLLDAAARFRRDELTEIATRLGDQIVNAAVQSDRGMSWETIPGNPHLLGYAHGTAGIACSLLELSAATGIEHFRKTALEAIRYERSHFSPQHRNWPDLRSLDGGGTPNAAGPGYPVAWCHGAPGVGFSRLRILELTNDPECQAEIDAALETTLAALPMTLTPGTGNFSLCHGAAGNADFVHTTALQLNRPELSRSVAEVAQYGISQYHDNDIPWPCGVVGSGETPNLMMGLAGIGYFYLRLHAPANVPSILLLKAQRAEPTNNFNLREELTDAIASH
jgi:lantibiotic modifying enzyme